MCPEGSEKPELWLYWLAVGLGAAVVVVLGALGSQRCFRLTVVVCGVVSSGAWTISRAYHLPLDAPSAIEDAWYIIAWFWAVLFLSVVAPMFGAFRHSHTSFHWKSRGGAVIILAILSLLFLGSTWMASEGRPTPLFVFMLVLSGFLCWAVLEGVSMPTSATFALLLTGTIVVFLVPYFSLSWGSQIERILGTMPWFVVIMANLLHHVYVLLTDTLEQRRAKAKYSEVAEQDKYRRMPIFVARTAVNDNPEGVELAYHATAQEEPAISIRLQDMNLYLPSGQRILKDISLVIPPGNTVAVMGPSGSGKSSITNVLSGRAGYGVVSGEIAINGKGGNEVTLEDLRSVSGFVPQDDVMNRTLTVYENVRFQAELRLPRTARDEGKTAIDVVTAVLEEMGVLHVRDTLIGDEETRGVSGGQRKRVSIAMELISQPALLFLDEPTSGLDSTTSHSVVEVVTRYAKVSRCTTLAVIHQPRFETLQLFDQVILLAAGGYLVFSGSTQVVVDYFEQKTAISFPPRANPADVFMDAITIDVAQKMAFEGRMAPMDEDVLSSPDSFGEHLARLWTSNRDTFLPMRFVNPPLPSLNVSRSHWGQALETQATRAIAQLRREVRQQAMIGGLLTLGLVAVINGLPTQFSIPNMMVQPMLALFYLMLLQTVASTSVFGGSERAVAWREAGVNVDLVFYFIGRDFAALIQIFMGAFIFTIVYGSLGPLSCDASELFWTAFAFLYACWGVGYIFSITLPSSSAQMLLVLFSFLNFLLAGVQPPFEVLRSLAIGAGIHLMALSPIRWAYGHLMYVHMTGHSQFENPLVRELSVTLAPMGYPLKWVQESGWSCTANEYPVYLRWAGCAAASHVRYQPLDRPSLCEQLLPDGAVMPPNAFICGTSQLYLLGLFFRLMALAVLFVIAKQHAHGGSRAKVYGLAKMLRPCLLAFLLVLIPLEIALLLETY